MSKRHLTAATLLLPATAIVVVFLCLPLLLLLRYSLNSFVPGQFMVEALSTENYVKLFADPYYRAVLQTTIVMAIGIMIASVALGFPLAMFIARAESRRKPLLLLLVILPLFVSNAVRAAGWMVMFGQRGIVNYVLAGTGLSSVPWTIMYTPTAVFIGVLSVNLPFVVLTLQSVLEGLEQNVSDASLSLGATPLETWRLVTFPLAMPGVLAASVLSFIMAMNAYATPVLLGGPQFQMMAPLVGSLVLQQTNWPLGAAASFALVATTLILTASASIFVLRRYSR